MTLVKLILDIKDQAWIDAHPTKVLLLNEPIYRNDGKVAYGDASTPLSALVFKPLFSGSTSWGDITGDIQDQTDLVSYVDGSISTVFSYIGYCNSIDTAASITPLVRAQSNTYRVRALDVDAIINNVAGVTQDGNRLTLMIKDNGTSRSLTFNSVYRFNAVAAPLKTVPGKWIVIDFVENAIDSKWDCVGCSIQVEQSSGGAVTFEKDRIYGTFSSPVTGNITVDVSNANLLARVLILHNDSILPSFPHEFKKLFGNYVTGVVNRIWCIFIDSSHIDYSVSQEFNTSIGPPTSGNRQFGDSITKEPFQYPPMTSGYAALFDEAKSITSQNLAYPSQGIWEGFCNYAGTLLTVPDSESLSLMMGLNDARLSPTRQIATDIITGGAAGIFAKHYAAVQRTFASGTQTGTWLNYGPGPIDNGNPPRLNSTIAASQTPGDTISLSFNGDTVFATTLLQSIGTNDSNGSRGFTIHIDGVLKYTFDPSILNAQGSDSIQLRGSAPNQYGWTPYAFILTGLGAGSHTCLFTVTAGTGTYFAWIDSLLEMYPHTSVGSTKPSCWIEIPTLNAAGSSGSFTDAAQIAQINVDVWASPQFQWFQGYTNFGRVQTNNYYDPNDSAQVYSDNVHPSGYGDSSTGSYKIAQPLIAIMS